MIQHILNFLIGHFSPFTVAHAPPCLQMNTADHVDKLSLNTDHIPADFVLLIIIYNYL